jgi:hypothetical protein
MSRDVLVDFLVVVQRFQRFIRFLRKHHSSTKFLKVFVTLSFVFDLIYHVLTYKPFTCVGLSSGDTTTFSNGTYI